MLKDHVSGVVEARRTWGFGIGSVVDMEAALVLISGP